MIAHITEACDEGIEAISEGQSEKVSRGTALCVREQLECTGVCLGVGQE